MRRPTRVAAMVPLAVVLFACTRPRSQPSRDAHPIASAAPSASAPVETGSAAVLRDVDGFTAGPLVRDPAYVRRTYVRGAKKIVVTIGEPGEARVSFDAWVRMSAADPPVALDVPPGSASGFYDCAGTGADERCDAHLHFRSGHHVEVSTGRTTTRAELDALLRGLPLRSLVSGASGHAPSFRRDVEPHLARTCAGATGCHGDDPTDSVELDLRPKNAYAQLVGRPAAARPTAVLVNPGSPETSFVVDKLTGRLGKDEGKTMPLDPDTGVAKDPTPDDRAFVDDVLVPWIRAGAADD